MSDTPHRDYADVKRGIARAHKKASAPIAQHKAVIKPADLATDCSPAAASNVAKTSTK